MYEYNELKYKNFQTLIFLSRKVGQIDLSPFYPRSKN